MLIRVAVVLAVGLLGSMSSAALDWSFCHGLDASAVANGSVVCPAGWHTRYAACGQGAQAPLSFSHGNVVVDANLRPFDLNWIASQQMRLEVQPSVSLTATPLDVKPALWEPNEGAAYALQHVAFASPSLHAVGGGRRDLEVSFIHTRRGEAPAHASSRLVVSMVFDASPVRPDHEALRTFAFPVVVEGVTSVNTSLTHPQRADFAAAAPASRDYVLYDAAGATPPCHAGTRHVVMQEVGGVSLEQVARIRAAIGLDWHPVHGVAQADGNVRPLQAAVAGTPARRFVDYAGDHLFTAEPNPQLAGAKAARAEG